MFLCVFFFKVYVSRVSYGVRGYATAQTAAGWMECVCVCAGASLTASEWSQSVIILSKVEGSLLDTSIHQPQRQRVCVCVSMVPTLYVCLHILASTCLGHTLTPRLADTTWQGDLVGVLGLSLPFFLHASDRRQDRDLVWSSDSHLCV